MLDTPINGERAHEAKENVGYHQTLMEGLHDLYEEAARDGLLKQAEDLIDIMWASVPTDDKLKIKVYDLETVKKLRAVDAWKEAQTIQPPAGLDKRSSDWQNNIRHKERCSRKAQIWTDVVKELGFLYKRLPFMLAEPDAKDVKEWEELEADDGPDEGLAGPEDKEEA
jgi:hypothetical protein